MKCVSQKEWMEFVDEEVSQSQKEALRKHLQECPRCRLFVEELRLTKKLLRELPILQAPREFEENLPWLIQRAKQKKRVRRYLPVIVSFVSLAAVVLLFALPLFDPQRTFNAEKLAKKWKDPIPRFESAQPKIGAWKPQREHSEQKLKLEQPETEALEERKEKKSFQKWREPFSREKERERKKRENLPVGVGEKGKTLSFQKNREVQLETEKKDRGGVKSLSAPAAPSLGRFSSRKREAGKASVLPEYPPLPERKRESKKKRARKTLLLLTDLPLPKAVRLFQSRFPFLEVEKVSYGYWEEDIRKGRFTAPSKARAAQLVVSLPLEKLGSFFQRLKKERDLTLFPGEVLPSGSTFEIWIYLRER